MKKILIIGDSWGWGEWDLRCSPGYTSSHYGLMKYLEDEGNEVINLSISAGNLYQTIDMLTHTKGTGKLKTFDYTFCFVTDATRHYHHPGFWEISNTRERALMFQNEILEDFYTQLNSFNIKIGLIGGLSKLRKEQVEKFDNLTCITESMIELVQPHLKQWDVFYEEQLKFIPDNLSNEYIDYVEKQVKLWDDIKKNNLIFCNDNRHPNRAAHFILKEHIRFLPNPDTDCLFRKRIDTDSQTRDFFEQIKYIKDNLVN